MIGHTSASLRLLPFQAPRSFHQVDQLRASKDKERSRHKQAVTTHGSNESLEEAAEGISGAVWVCGEEGMDVKRSRSPRAPADGEDDKKRAGWRGGGVRPEMVLVGFLLTLPLLFLVFGGRWGSGSFPSSSPSTATVAARNVAGGGRGATPQSKSKLPCPLLLPRRFGF